MAAAFLLAAFFTVKNYASSVKQVTDNIKPFLTVNDAKIRAFQSNSPQTILNLKGIYTIQQQSVNKSVLLLEDEDPSAMEDVPFYCILSKNEMIYELEPGTELTLSGTLARNGNSVELTNCRIICINKGTINTDYLSWQ